MEAGGRGDGGRCGGGGGATGPAACKEASPHHEFKKKERKVTWINVCHLPAAVKPTRLSLLAPPPEKETGHRARIDVVVWPPSFYRAYKIHPGPDQPRIYTS